MNTWALLMVGLAGGVVLTLPLAWGWTRRTAAQVRRLEQRARAAERLAELGTLTGGLAHEIKNPLSTVGLNIQLLKEDLNEVADQAGDTLSEQRIQRLHHRFDSLRRETQRLRDILEDFLRFAGRVELDLQPTDLNELVAELADFFEPQARAAGVHIRTQLQADPSVAPLDSGLLKQALLNLLINASQAMNDARQRETPHGGADELILRTQRGKTLGREEIHLHLIDTGPGMDQEVAAKIFQPYFSTKRGGTGLGLPTARRIIEEHHGQITVHPEPARGTDFLIRLPLSNEKTDSV